MKLRHLGAALIALVCAVSAAEAKPRHDSETARGCVYGNTAVIVCHGPEYRTTASPRVSGHDPRPTAWCGWQMRQWLGVADRAYNLARKWAGFGSRASGPAPGVIAVYPHHVGIVVSVPGPGRMVMKSGNDGHAIRTRERSTRGVIAWRWPPQRMAGL